MARQLTLGLRVMISVKEAAQLLEVEPSQVRHLVRKERIEGDRSTGVLLCDQNSVIHYRQSRGPWRPGGVLGGKKAALRMGVINEARRR